MPSSTSAYYSIRTKPPTYLKDFLSDYTEILLLFDKKESANDIAVNSLPQNNVNNCSSNELDYTGTPLEVDLNGDESLQSIAVTEKPDNWTKEEAKYFPFTLKQIRKFVNELLKKKCDLEVANNIPILGLCDGSDNLKTVVIGGLRLPKSLTTFAAYMVGNFNIDHEYLTLNYMQKEHLKFVNRSSVKIDYTLRSSYYVFGHDLKKVNVETSACFSSIYIEAIWNTFKFTIPSSANVKMTLQAIMGHPESPIHYFWDELCLLQRFIEILLHTDKDELELAEICNEPLKEIEIENKIEELITNIDPFVKAQNHNGLDLKNLRQLNLLDKLWLILKQCENLSSLRDMLTSFMERLAESDIHINFKEDNSRIATIVSGIINGKLSVPTVNFAQSVELLFELGAEKIKNDYLAIISYFHPLAASLIKQQWSEFCADNVALNNMKRKTSMSAKLAVTNMPQSTQKLSYLGQMHIVADFMFLINDYSKLTEQSCDYFHDKVCKKYLESFTGNDFSNLFHNRLCEFSFSINYNDIMNDSRFPDQWSIKMTSKDHSDYEISTLFHLSVLPIFPFMDINNVNDSVHVDVDTSNERTCYLTKYLKIVEFV